MVFPSQKCLLCRLCVCVTMLVSTENSPVWAPRPKSAHGKILRCSANHRAIPRSLVFGTQVCNRCDCPDPHNLLVSTRRQVPLCTTTTTASPPSTYETPARVFRRGWQRRCVCTSTPMPADRASVSLEHTGPCDESHRYSTGDSFLK